MKLFIRLICIAILGFLVACASAPKASNHDERVDSHKIRADKSTAKEAANYARNMVGKPYRYGGNSPSGFDCSGLVQYSYARAGLSIPRTTRSQQNIGVPVSARSLRAGDLVFFDQEGKKLSHVGIYLGGNSFVHAPSGGKRVRVDSLNKRYWKKHFAGGRRI